MTAHTPAPWRMAFEPGNDRIPPYFRGVVGPDNEKIRVEGTSLSSGPEAMANARLIASAPDLLSALQMVVDRVDFERGMKKGPYDGEDEELLMFVRSIIAKATT